MDRDPDSYPTLAIWILGPDDDPIAYNTRDPQADLDLAAAWAIPTFALLTTDGRWLDAGQPRPSSHADRARTDWRPTPTADLLDGTQAYVLAVVEHATRRIRILGVTLHPTGQWTAQQARNLLIDLGEQAEQVKFMIRDRGSNFTVAFDAVLADADIRTVLCNVRTPRMNAITERWIGGCPRELLDRTLIWNQAHLHQMLRRYEAHHNQHRPHRSLHGTAPLKPPPEPADLDHYRVRKRARVGGLINEYHLVA